MSPSRFETIVEIREDWIPLHAHIPSIHHNLHHDRRDKVENKKKHKHKEIKHHIV